MKHACRCTVLINKVLTRLLLLTDGLEHCLEVSRFMHAHKDVRPPHKFALHKNLQEIEPNYNVGDYTTSKDGGNVDTVVNSEVQLPNGKKEKDCR